MNQPEVKNREKLNFILSLAQEFTLNQFSNWTNHSSILSNSTMKRAMIKQNKFLLLSDVFSKIINNFSSPQLKSSSQLEGIKTFHTTSVGH